MATPQTYDLKGTSERKAAYLDDPARRIRYSAGSENHPPMNVLSILFYSFAAITAAADGIFPGEHWQTRTPEEAGLVQEKLEQLRDLVGGRGCVVRHGCMVFQWGDQTKSGDVAS